MWNLRNVSGVVYGISAALGVVALCSAVAAAATLLPIGDEPSPLSGLADHRVLFNTALEPCTCTSMDIAKLEQALDQQPGLETITAESEKKALDVLAEGSKPASVSRWVWPVHPPKVCGQPELFDRCASRVSYTSSHTKEMRQPTHQRRRCTRQDESMTKGQQI